MKALLVDMNEEADTHDTGSAGRERAGRVAALPDDHTSMLPRRVNGLVKKIVPTEAERSRVKTVIECEIWGSGLVPESALIEIEERTDDRRAGPDHHSPSCARA